MFFKMQLLRWWKRKGKKEDVVDVLEDTEILEDIRENVGDMLKNCLTQF